MIQYAKVILPKVCLWEELYKKELQKCVGWSSPEELKELRNWCYENFNDLYSDIHNEVFFGTNFKSKKYGTQKTGRKNNLDLRFRENYATNKNNGRKVLKPY